MTDIESSNFSETAASNNAATPNGWPEGQAPSTVNDCAREFMGAAKREWNRAGPTVTSGGSANAQTLTYTTAVAALVRGQKYSFVAGFTNTGATTLAVSGLAATAVRLFNAALTGGEIVAGQTYRVMYDGTAYQLVNYSLRGTVNPWTAAQYFTEATLTDAGPTTWNLATQQNAVWTLGASRTLSTPTNMVAGQTGNLEIRQDGSGNRIITWPSSSIFKWPGGAVPVLSTAAGAVDLLSYKCRASDMLVSLQKGFA